MNRRSLLFALIVCGGLVMVGIWQLNTPAPRGKALKPSDIEARLDEDTEAARPPSGELPGSPLNEPTPQPKKLAPPPAAPSVENDPAKGRIWLRLLDAETNQPLRMTPCELLQLKRNEALFDIARTEERRVTDLDGLIALSVVIVADSRFQEEAESAEVVWYYSTHEVLRVPLPKSYMPATGATDVARAMKELLEVPSDVPIDLYYTREATLRIVARDEWGQPLPAALLEYYWHPLNDSADEWMCLHDEVGSFSMPSEWPRWFESRRQEYRSQAASAVFEERDAFGGRVDNAIRVEYGSSELAKGSTVIRGLPCVRFAAIGSLSGIGIGDAIIDLQPGGNELNVYLRTQPTCTLNVRIEWYGEKLNENESATVWVRPAAPFGGPTNVFAHPDNVTYRWVLAATGSTSWQGQITGLPPGCWSVEAGVEYGNDGSASIRLEDGQVGNITLYCGPAALARWTPIIRLGSEQLEQSSIRILGGEYYEPAAETIWFDSASALTTELELIAGTYTVWIPTLQPMQVSLLPGEKRSDVFELHCATVRFSIDAPLADLLSFEGADVQLNLYPGDEWDSADEHLLSIDADLRKADEAYDQLNPGVVRVWTIPLARYSWHLIGTDQEIQGSIDLMTAGSTSVHFGLRNLPGYELCEIEFSGFTEGEEPHIEFSDDGTAHVAINAFSGPPDEPDFLADVSYVVGDRGAIDVLYSADKKVVYAFGARGGAQLLVYEVTYTSFRVSFPGRLVVTPGHLGAPLDGKLLLDAGESEFTWQVTVFHEDGGYGVGQVGGELEMAIGWVTLVVSRQASGGVTEMARVQVRLSTEPQTLNLNSLAYEPFAQVTLVFKGRGSPDSPFDAWWYGDAKPAPLMLALDQSFGGAPRYVGLGDPDRVMPDGRLEFTYDNRMLPPGRYKVIPWPGAAEKYCKTFTLAPGETSSVVVQGG
jgi:hypothetical protein